MSNGKRMWDSVVGYWSFVLLILGVVFSLVALLIVVLRPDVEKTFTATADGVVSQVEVKHSGKRNSRTSYVTYVTFEDGDHRTFEAMSVVNGDWHRHDEGDRVVVRYNPQNPEEGVLIAGDEDKLGSFNAFGSFMRYGGIIALGLGLVGLAVCKLRAH